MVRKQSGDRRAGTSFVSRKVSDIVDVQPRTHRIKTNEYLERGLIPVIDQGEGQIAGYIDDPKRAYDGPLPVVIFGDHTCSLKFTASRFAVGADGTQLLTGKDSVDTRFLFYALHCAPIEQFGYQRHFKLLKQSEIPVPPLPVQCRIASILGTYDDLIEVNRQRIALQEEMARRLFEEWFVRFRFPGHEGCTTVELPDGPLPGGWRWEPMEAVCAQPNGIQTGPFGSQLHQSDYADEGVPVVMPKNIVDLHIVENDIARISEDKADELGRHRMTVGDVVYGRRGDIGRRAYITTREDGWFCGTGCLRMRPDARQVRPRYFFDTLGLPTTLAAIRARAQGATMPNLSAGAMSQVAVMVPPIELQQRYENVAEPLAASIANLRSSNVNLGFTRDLLLPRLVSGELYVTEPELEAVA